MVRPRTCTGFLAAAAAAIVSLQSGDVRAEAPPASEGFQLALRTGYSLPMGSATGVTGDDLSKSFSGQVPIIVDIGGKPTKNIFVGGYLGVGVGGGGSAVRDTCTGSVSCTAVSARLGAEILYGFTPASTANPWLGYGIGFESNQMTVSGYGREASITASGFEFGHFMGGIDFRVSSGFGIGPYIDFAIGEYSTVKQDFGNQSVSGDIAKKAMHEWFTIGPRFVFWP